MITPCQGPSWTAVLPSMALLLVAFGASTGRAGVVPQGFVKDLRAACAAEPSLHGVRVQGAEVENGRLHLRGSLDRAEQADVLAAAAQRLIDDEPSGKEALPGGVSTEGMTVFPVRSEYLRRLQRDFAAQPPGLLKRTRLDDAYYDQGDRLHLAGLCIDTAAYLERRAGSGATPGGESPLDQLSRAVRSRLNSYLAADGFSRGGLERLELDQIRFEPSPVRALQRLANDDARLDGLLFQDAWFAADGALQLVGLAGSREQWAAASSLLRHPDLAALQPRGLDGFKPVHSLDTMRVVDWNAPLLKALQARMAGKDVWKYCRLTRARFVYPERGTLVLRFEGVGFLAGQAGAGGVLTAFLRDGCRTALRLPIPLNYNIEDAVAQVPNPRSAFRARVAADPVLDGVRVDDVAFGPRGEVALSGLWLSPAQRPTLERSLGPVLRDRVPGLAAGAPAWDVSGMVALPTDRLLRDLRAWASTLNGEVCLERATFAASESADSPSPPILVLRGFCGAAGEPAVKARLSQWVAGHAVTAQLTARTPSARSDPPGRPWALALTQKPTSLIAELRKLVPRDPALDGVRVDRGTYDEHLAFVLTGLQDHPGQAEALGPMLRDLATERGWLDQLPGGVRVGAFTVFALRPLLSFLARELPADPAFDGVTIDRAYYDERRALVLAGRAVGRRERADLSGALKALLRADRNLEVRAELTPEAADPDLPGRAVARALELVEGGNYRDAEPLLDAALLHDPTESLAWYLRAGCHQNSGDTALAERDVRRMLDLERRSPHLARSRYQRLTRLQGPFRATMNDLEARLGPGPGGR